MKKLITLVILFIFSFTSNASHMMGGEISYDFISGNTYLFRFTFYRDCSGINAPTFVTLNYSSANCSSGNLSLDLNATISSPQQIVPICSGATTTCNGGIYVGIERWEYEGTVTLPSNCNDWTFSISDCCRNAAITNIQTPGSESAYFSATLNNLDVAFNNSVRFSNYPVPFLYAGSQFTYSNGAFDLEGDSIHVSLTSPKTSDSTTVTYLSPFSYLDPISSTPPLSLNPLTGDFIVTPTLVEVGVMAILVEEFRNGFMVGSFTRDIQMNVVAQNNSMPQLTGINGANGNVYQACAGDTVQFNVISADADAGQITTINPLSAPAGFQFINSGGSRDTLHVSLITDVSMINSYPMILSLQVNDDACPYFGTQNYDYQIFVNGCGSDVWPGDANGDLNCNIYDVLPIGLGFNSTGPARSGTSLSWTAQTCTDWSQSQSSGMNFKYADCDGNGTIEWIDTLGISANYGLTHPLRLASTSLSIDDASLHLQLNNSTASPGSPVILSVQLGDATQSAQDVYGIAYRINFDPQLLDPAQSSLIFTTGQLGTPGSDLLTFARPNWAGGFVDIAAVRTDHNPVTVNDVFAELHFVVAPTAPLQSFTFNVTVVQAVDNLGAFREYPCLPASLSVEQPTGIKNIPNLRLEIYPNPVNTSLFMRSSEMLEEIILRDVQGRIVLRNPVKSIETTVDVSMLPKGFYLAELTTGKGIVRRQVCVQ